MREFLGDPEKTPNLILQNCWLSGRGQQEIGVCIIWQIIASKGGPNITYWKSLGYVCLNYVFAMWIIYKVYNTKSNNTKKKEWKKVPLTGHRYTIRHRTVAWPGYDGRYLYWRTRYQTEFQKDKAYRTKYGSEATQSRSLTNHRKTHKQTIGKEQLYLVDLIIYNYVRKKKKDKNKHKPTWSHQNLTRMHNKTDLTKTDTIKFCS